MSAERRSLQLFLPSAEAQAKTLEYHENACDQSQDTQHLNEAVGNGQVSGGVLSLNVHDGRAFGYLTNRHTKH